MPPKFPPVTKAPQRKADSLLEFNRPKILAALQAGRTSFKELPLKTYQKDDLQKLSEETGASEYIKFTDTGHLLQVGGAGYFVKVNLELDPELLK